MTIDSIVVEAVTGGVGGSAAAVCVAIIAAVAAAAGSPVVVGAGMGEDGIDSVGAGGGSIGTKGSIACDVATRSAVCAITGEVGSRFASPAPPQAVSNAPIPISKIKTKIPVPASG